MGHSPVNTWTKPLIRMPYSVRPPPCKGGGGGLPSHFTIPLLYFLNAPNQTAHFPQEMSKFPTSAYVAPSCLPYFCCQKFYSYFKAHFKCQLPSWSLFWCSWRWTRDTHAASSVFAVVVPAVCFLTATCICISPTNYKLLEGMDSFTPLVFPVCLM